MLEAEGAWPSIGVLAVNTAMKARNQETLCTLMIHPYTAGDSGTGNLGPVSFLSFYSLCTPGN